MKDFKALFDPFDQISATLTPQQKVMQKIREENYINEQKMQFLDEINEIVSEIHSEFGKSCLIFRIEHLDTEKRCALWTVSNLYLNTPFRQQASQYPQEFVLVKTFLGQTKNSAIVISEFNVSVKLLIGAYTTNPYDLQDIADKIKLGLIEQKEMKQARMETL